MNLTEKKVSQPLWLALDDYSTLYQSRKKAGEGVAGEVYLATCVKTKCQVAIKEMSSTEKTTAESEAYILHNLNHPNIIKSLTCIKLPHKWCLVLEAMPMNLHQRMISKSFSFEDVRLLMKQLLQGVTYLHSQHLTHRDLKPANLLVGDLPKPSSQYPELKICDFGHAVELEDGKASASHELQTLWYRAPELLLGAQTHTTAIDLWSAGCIFAELLNHCYASGKIWPLFMGYNGSNQLRRIIEFFGYPTETTWPGISKLPLWEEKWVGEGNRSASWKGYFGRQLAPLTLDLLNQLLTLNPSQRITAQKALEHDFFQASATELAAQEEEWSCTIQ